MSKPQPTITTEALQRQVLADAEEATAQEHKLSFFNAVKLYSRAVFWSVVMSSALIMDGYDTKVVGTLLAQPQFQRRYGFRLKNGTYQLSAAWQSGLNNGSNAAQIIGMLCRPAGCGPYVLPS